MAKTKREYILATCFLSGAAAILSFVSLGTRAWVTSDTLFPDENDAYRDGGHISFGVFGGTFVQTISWDASFDLTMVCLFDKNVCALLCGSNKSDNLRKIYNGEEPSSEETNCALNSASGSSKSSAYFEVKATGTTSAPDTADIIFINAGIWICTIIFLIISGVIGIFSAGLSIWNTVSNPYQVYFSTFGLYIYNAVAAGTLLLSIILWGAMFAKDLTHNIPSYKTILEEFTTDGLAQLGYSYWINLASLILYLMSIILLYVRNYLISKEPAPNIHHLEDSADPVIYLY